MDFFRPDLTYIQNEPFRAPELVGIFKAVAVTDHPANGEQVAFGFYATAHPGDGWHRAALMAGDWAEGWVPADRIDGVWVPRSGSWDTAMSNRAAS